MAKRKSRSTAAAGVSKQALTEQPPQSSTTNAPEHWLCKNRLQEYTQRSSLPLPVYRTINEGAQQEPMFRSTVFVDGTYITSPNTFCDRKAAEQDVASFALASLIQKTKEEGYAIIREDTVFCKSILNEYAMKMNLDKPTYNTIQPEGLLPVFISSLVFNGVNYTGEAGRSKKEAEQLAARAVILSIFGNSESETVILEIIKSKFRLYAALHKLKASHSFQDGNTPLALNTGTDFVFPFHNEKEVGITQGANNVISITSSVIFEAYACQLSNIPAMQKPFQNGNTPLAPNTGTDFVFPFSNEKEIESTGNGNPPLVKTGIPSGNNVTSSTSSVFSKAYANHLSKTPAMQLSKTPALQLSNTPLLPNTGTDFVSPFRYEKEVESTENGKAPLVVNPGIPSGNGKEVGSTQGANNVASTVVSESFASQLRNILAMRKPFNECKNFNGEPSSVAYTGAFVPPALEQPLGVGPSSAEKRKHNKKKRKKLQVDAQLPVDVSLNK